MSPSLPEFLKHILEECDFILEVTQNKTSEQTFDDKTVSRAIIRSLEIIGEAAKKLDDDFRLQHPQIEWKKIAGTRDMIIHHYFGIDYDIVWNIITNKIPDLQHLITSLLEELG